MSESENRVQEALAAHIEHAELGGPQPDTSHLNAEELEKLRELIELLDDTEGVGFGRGLESGRPSSGASTQAGVALVAKLHEALPSAARITSDPSAPTIDIAGLDVTEGWIVGTFGGRIRVWLLAQEGALESSNDWLRDLGRVFRTYPDTAAIALVEPDDSCLLVQPEDCSPRIEVPRGSLVGRRYRRPIHPVDEALSVFLRELIPYWEPMLDISEPTAGTIAVMPIAQERASRAIEEQVAAGGRARKTNPKRKALTELGDGEIQGVADLLQAVNDGRTTPDEIDQELRRLAQKR